MPLYCRALIDWTLQPTHRTGDMTTDMPFPAYAPGLYTAIAAMADIGLPIYITETGICDHTTLKRPSFFRAYFEQVGNWVLQCNMN
jgi:beta-glucosidase/6-phospho-beta-glucosidase/beta-galactosidase